MSYFDFLDKYWPEYLSGLLITLQIALIAIVVGLAIGLGLALLSLHRSRVVRYLTIAVVEVGRGIPSVIVLYLAYFGLPSADIVLSSYAAAAAGLSFTMAAYSSETIRAGIKEVPIGQIEAADALSLSWTRKMALVVLPQAVRNVTPPLIALTIALFQATALAYAISVPELLSRAFGIASLTYQYTPALLTAGIVYAIFSLSASLAVRLVQRPRRRVRTPPPATTIKENHAVTS